MTDLLVYAVGDSVMWGQGLDHSRKFATLAAASLAQARGRTPNLKVLAHSGAAMKTTREQRDRFVNWFPHLFGSDEAKSQFLGLPNAGTEFVPDERPAEQLHGEIPRFFPTVHHQLRSIPEAEAAALDLLLLTGGANDLDFESIFTTGGDFVAKLDGQYERIFHNDIHELIVAARQRCPRAQIVLTGYYSAFSPDSNFNDVRDLFLAVQDKKTEYDALTTVRLVATLTSAFLVAFILHVILNEADDKIKAAVELARATSETGESRGNYWMRRAVTEISDNPAIRGPGIVFAAPGFRPENCLFAPASLIWQRFDQNKLDDDQRSARAENCPRNRMRDRMADTASRNELAAFPPHTQLAPADLIDLHNALDGPVSLLEALEALAKKPDDFQFREKVTDQLRNDVNRIDLTRIASLFHPNRAGAKRYASVIHKRAEELRQSTSLRERVLAFMPPGLPPAPLEIGRSFRRLGLDPAPGVRSCIPHAEPDVLCLTVRTHVTSGLLTSDVYLDLGAAGKRLKLRHLLTEDLVGGLKLNPHFKPGKTDVFTIDVAGQLRIGDITQLVIDIGKERKNAVWRPEAVTLSIDGREVHQHLFPSPPDVSSTLDLQFPN